eukprot:m.92593 g.92593  ORF g.92593 m.92593 type:complete len:1437 (-) comp9964_c0_seq2:206-4516(-)
MLTGWPPCCVVLYPSPSKRIKEALEELKRRGHSHVELQSDSIDESPEKIKVLVRAGHIFITDVTEGSSFRGLDKARCWIVGPMVVLACAKTSRPPPKRHKDGVPVLTYAMHGVTVCCTGVQVPIRNQIYQRVRMMGGSADRHLNADVTHVIASAWGSQKCVVATELGKPVMTVDWVEDLWKASATTLCDATDEAFVNKHRLPIFKDTIISVTGLDWECRAKVEKLTKTHGGMYSPSCHDRVTHLIAEKPEGAKFEFAIANGIKVVRSEWHSDCIKAGARLVEDRYEIDSGQDTVDGVDDAVACASVTPDEEQLKIAADPDNLYLDGCSILLCNATGKREKWLNRLVRAGGGTRHDTLTPNVTHVVYSGSEIDRTVYSGHLAVVVPDAWLVACYRAGELLPTASYTNTGSASSTAAPDHQPSDPSPRRQSKQPATARAGPLISDDFSNLFNDSDGNGHAAVRSADPPSATTDGAATRHTTDANRMGVDTAAGAASQGHGRHAHGAAHHDSASANGYRDSMGGAAARDAGHAAPPQQPKPLIGFFFVLNPTWVGAAGASEHHRIVAAIEGCGGAVVPASVVVTADRSCTLLVTADGYTVADATLQSLPAVTVSWLERCIDGGELIDPTSNRLFTPMERLSRGGGMSGADFSNVVLCLSGFEDMEKAHLLDVCRLVKIRHTLQLKKGRNTHLVCASATGAKYDKARKWRLATVSRDWLFQSIRRGTVLPSDAFAPPATAAPDAVPCDANTLREYIAHPPSSPPRPCFNTRDVLAALSPRGSAASQPTHDTTTMDTETQAAGPNGLSSHHHQQQQQHAGVGASTRSPSTPTITVTTATTVLSGVSIMVSGARSMPEAQRCMLRTTAERLGAVVVTHSGAMDMKKCTHYVFAGKTRDSQKEYQAAKKAGAYIVHPEWVLAAERTGVRQSEEQFPSTYDPERALPTTAHRQPSRSLSGPSIHSPVFTANTPRRSPRKHGMGDSSPTHGGKGGNVVDSRSLASGSGKSGDSGKSSSTSSSRPTKPVTQSDRALQLAIDRLIRMDKSKQPLKRGRFSSQHSGGKTSQSTSDAEEGGAGNGDTRRKHRFNGTGDTLVEEDEEGGQDDGAPVGTLTQHEDDDLDFDPEDDSSSQMAVTYRDRGRERGKTALKELLKASAKIILSPYGQALGSSSAGGPHSCGGVTPHANQRQPFFLLTGMEDSRKAEFSEIICSLDGKVDDAKIYKEACTHLIVGNPTRSEKFLSACAAGKWILTEAYIEDSGRQGRWLDESSYEWGPDRTTSHDSSKAALVLAPRTWRERVAKENQGAFHGWRVMLFFSKPDGFRRLLQAGGASVYSHHDTVPEGFVASHAFYGKKEFDEHAPALAELAQKQATHILRQDYISEYLIGQREPDMDDFRPQSLHFEQSNAEARTTSLPRASPSKRSGTSQRMGGSKRSRGLQSAPV